MADVINLRLARKARARHAASETAAENRARHGQTRAERQAQTRETIRAARELAGKRRDETEPSPLVSVICEQSSVPSDLKSL
jgi:sRNA-binding protein